MHTQDTITTNRRKLLTLRKPCAYTPIHARYTLKTRLPLIHANCLHSANPARTLRLRSNFTPITSRLPTPHTRHLHTENNAFRVKRTPSSNCFCSPIFYWTLSQRTMLFKICAHVHWWKIVFTYLGIHHISSSYFLDWFCFPQNLHRIYFHYHSTSHARARRARAGACFFKKVVAMAENYP